MDSLEKKMWDLLPDKAERISPIERYRRYLEFYGRETKPEEIEYTMRKRYFPKITKDNHYELGQTCIYSRHFVRALKYLAEDRSLDFYSMLEISQALNLGKRELNSMLGFVYDEKTKILEEAQRTYEDLLKGGYAGCSIAYHFKREGQMSFIESHKNRIKEIIEKISSFEKSYK